MSSWPISIRYEGKPQGKGRARVKTLKGKTWGYTPAKTASYEDGLKWLAKDAMRGLKPCAGPVMLEAYACFKSKEEFYTKKPDCDNIFKILADSLNKIVYLDDAQITTMAISKITGTEDYISIKVTPL